MTLAEWSIFGGFIAMLLGLSLVNAKLAAVAGLGAIGIIFLKYLGRNDA